MTPQLESQVAHLEALVGRLVAVFSEMVREIEHEPEPHPLIRIVYMLAGVHR